MTPVIVTEGEGPLVLGLPHSGTHVPDEVLAGLNDTGRALADTDWHVDRLYDGLVPGASVVRATFHRYVIDANRDPSGASLYPGQATTALCPLTDFDGHPLHREGQAPNADEVARRLALFHTPYHAALADQMERVRARHGFAVLFDCHSIRSRIPYLFEGLLPDLNLGTDHGATCAPAIQQAAEAVLAGAAGKGFTHVVNGRFRGGWTTRHYGRPARGWHAVQMELAQRTHLATEAAPFAYDPARADRLRPVLAALLDRIIAAARTAAAANRS